MGGALAYLMHDEERIRHVVTLVRLSAKMTQERAAAAAGVSVATLKRIEDGTATITAPQLAGLLNGCRFQLVAVAADSNVIPPGIG